MYIKTGYSRYIITFCPVNLDKSDNMVDRRARFIVYLYICFPRIITCNKSDENLQKHAIQT